MKSGSEKGKYCKTSASFETSVHQARWSSDLLKSGSGCLPQAQRVEGNLTVLNSQLDQP